MACLLAASVLACVAPPFNIFLLEDLLRFELALRLLESDDVAAFASFAADVTDVVLPLLFSVLLGHASDADDAGSGDVVNFGVELALVVVVADDDLADEVTEELFGESMEEERGGKEVGKPPNGDIQGYAPAYGPSAAEKK